jgi:hypothetical protein
MGARRTALFAALLLLAPACQPAAAPGPGGAAAEGGAPPGIKKGAQLHVWAESLPLETALTDHAEVEEVQGRWVRLRFVPNKAGQEAGRKGEADWVNFDKVVWYQVLPSGGPP